MGNHQRDQPLGRDCIVSISQKGASRDGDDRLETRCLSPRRGQPAERIAFVVYGSGSMEIYRQFGWMDVVGRRKHFHVECVAIAKWVALNSALTDRSVDRIEGPKFNV
jgi:hypothetical protein